MFYEKIKHNGWLQLSVLSEELQDAVNKDFSVNAIKKDDVLIVLSQSCDVLHHDFDKEPHIEVLVANKVEKFNKSFSDSRHPRILQFYVNSDGNKILLQAESHNRIVFPRKLLADYVPKKNIKILLGDNVIPMWIGKKYFRIALPDIFNLRLKTQIKAIKKLMERGHEPIERFFLSINTFDELADDQNYKIEILGVVSNKYKLSEANNLMTKLEGIIKDCKGITASNFSARMDSDITLKVISYYVAWTPYDYLSTSDSEK